MALRSIKLANLPSKGVPGDVFWTVDAKLTYWVCTDGTLICLNDLAAGAANGIRTVGAQGAQGETGAQGQIGLTGARGEKGTPGSDGATGPAGVDGKSITGPMGPRGETGAPGQSIVGPAGATGATGAQGLMGAKGDRGDVLIPNDSELAAAIITLRQKQARIQAAVLESMAGAQNLRPNVRAQVLAHLDAIKREAGL